MDLGHAAVCAAETGHVYVVAPTNNGDKAEVAGGGAAAGSVYLNIFMSPLFISIVFHKITLFPQSGARSRGIRVGRGRVRHVPAGGAAWGRRVATLRHRVPQGVYLQYLRNIYNMYDIYLYLPTQGNLYHLGGTATLDGPRFGYIWCSFDLQEFHTRYTERWGHIQSLLSAE